MDNSQPLLQEPDNSFGLPLLLFAVRFSYAEPSTTCTSKFTCMLTVFQIKSIKVSVFVTFTSFMAVQPLLQSAILARHLLNDEMSLLYRPNCAIGFAKLRYQICQTALSDMSNYAVRSVNFRRWICQTAPSDDR